MSEKLLQQILDEMKDMKSEMKNIQTQVAKIDGIEASLQKVHTKLDSITKQVVHNSEEISVVKAQTASNAELKAPIDAVISDVEDLRTDIKILKKAFTS